MLVDPSDDVSLISVGLRHAAESIRAAVTGAPANGFGAAGLALCAELYACAGRVESHLRDLAAVGAWHASLFESISVVVGEPRRVIGGSTESLVTVPDVSTYVLAVDAPGSERVALLEQAAGIVETMAAGLGKVDTYGLPVSVVEGFEVERLRQQINDFKELVAGFWDV